MSDHKAILVNGPQDGASIRSPAGDYPLFVYVGTYWHGDCFAAWSSHWSSRFPCCYERTLSTYDDTAGGGAFTVIERHRYAFVGYVNMDGPGHK